MNTSEVSEENQISKTGGYGGENRWLWGGKQVVMGGKTGGYGGEPPLENTGTGSLRDTNFSSYSL